MGWPMAKRTAGLDADKLVILLHRAHASTDVLAMLASEGAIDSLKGGSLCTSLLAIEEQISDAISLVTESLHSEPMQPQS